MVFAGDEYDDHTEGKGPFTPDATADHGTIQFTHCRYDTRYIWLHQGGTRLGHAGVYCPQ